MRVAVLGGRGVLGGQIVARLLERGHELVVAGRNDWRPAILAAPELAICAAPNITEALTFAAELGISTLDVSVSHPHRFLASLAETARTTGSRHLVSVGLMPGLSGVLAREALARFPDDQVDILLVQSSNAKVGINGVRDMLTLIVPTTKNAAPKPGWLRLDHPEAGTASPNGQIRYWTTWDDQAKTSLVGGLAKQRLLPVLARRLPDAALRRLAASKPHQPENCEIQVWVDGRKKLAVGLSGDYPATAAICAALVKMVPGLAQGVHRVWDVTGSPGILAGISDCVFQIEEC